MVFLLSHYICQIPGLSTKTSPVQQQNHLDLSTPAWTELDNVSVLCPLSAGLCTGQTGTERLRRSSVRQWTVRTAGWWCLTGSVYQTLSHTTPHPDKSAGLTQVTFNMALCSKTSLNNKTPLLVSHNTLIVLNTVALYCRHQAFRVRLPGWLRSTSDPPHPQLPVQHGLLQQPLLLHRLEEVAIFTLDSWLIR